MTPANGPLEGPAMRGRGAIAWRLTVGPKFSKGARIRIRARDMQGRVLYRELEGHDRETGVVVSAHAVIAYAVQPFSQVEPSGLGRTTLFVYSVDLDGGTTLRNLIEYCLEAV